jgi:transposase-like protein
MGRHEKPVDFAEIYRLYTEEGLTVEAICKRIDLSKPQLSQRCKRLYGQTAEKWLQAEIAKPKVEPAEQKEILKTASGLAGMQCSLEEICDKLAIKQQKLTQAVEATGVDLEVWYRMAKNAGITELKYRIWTAAQNGDATMQRVLAREYLGFGTSEGGMHESVTQVVISGLDGEKVLVDPAKFGPSDDES